MTPSDQQIRLRGDIFTTLGPLTFPKYTSVYNTAVVPFTSKFTSLNLLYVIINVILYCCSKEIFHCHKVHELK